VNQSQTITAEPRRSIGTAVAAGAGNSFKKFNRSSRSSIMRQKQKPRRPLLGAHMSIAGGVGNALLLGAKVQCEAIQIFTKSSRQWACKPYTEEEIAQYRENQKTTGIKKVIAHDSYLLNLGSPDVVLRQRSILAFIDEMERCENLGIGRRPRH
jgi:hypothetical protein